MSCHASPVHNEVLFILSCDSAENVYHCRFTTCHVPRLPNVAADRSLDPGLPATTADKVIELAATPTDRAQNSIVGFAQLSLYM